jgi:single-stranded-DNA-specific exonuclease
VDPSGLDARAIGFRLGPRINAAGRMQRADAGLELLLTEDPERARAVAEELDAVNAERRDVETRIRFEAEALLPSGPPAPAYVLASEGWHPGVIGIVASRLVEEFGRPTILIALSGDQGKGSGRSISKFDLHGALGQSKEYLLRYGGHRMAAGVTVARDQVPDFAARFNEVARSLLTPDDLVPEIRVDLEVSIDGMDQKIESLFRHFEPFGIGNPAPVLLARNVVIAKPPRAVGHDGLKLVLDTGTGSLEALGWGFAPRVAEFQLQPGSRIDIAFRLERDEYRGQSYLQARIADLRTSEPS